MAFSPGPCWRNVCIQYSKLDTVKTMGTHGKINAIWWNIKINVQKLADICGYEFPTNLQKFRAKRPNWSENFQKSFRGGLLFLKHPVHIVVYTRMVLNFCHCLWFVLWTSTCMFDWHFIGQGCAFGYHAGGWGKPPVDESGKPLYGDVFGPALQESQVCHSSNCYSCCVSRYENYSEVELCGLCPN